MTEEIPEQKMTKQLQAYARDLAEVYAQEKEKRKQLELTTKKLRATLDGVTDGVVTLDLQGHIIEANHTFANMFSLDVDTLIGQQLRDHLDKSAFLGIFTVIEDLSETTSVLINPDGMGQTHYKITCSPIGDKKRVQGVVLTFEDMSRKERVRRLKDEFLSLVSHEIKTPITGISGYLSHLKYILEDRLNEEEKEYFDIVNMQVDRLLRTVDSLLDFAQTVEQRKEQKRTFDLNDCIDDALQRIALKIAKKNIKIEQRRTDKKCEMMGFYDLLVSSICHLLDNATEYSPPQSPIEVAIEGDDRYWHIQVSDHGPGIPRDKIDDLFEPFFQAEYYLTRSHEGLGLGLSIVRKTAKLHGGEVTLENKKEGGVVATLQLPKFQPDIDREKEEELYRLRRQLSELKKQSLRYARDLAKTYSVQKQTTTQLRKTREQLLRSDKLSSMGQMVSGISHELKNMLNPIIGYSDIILKKRESLDPKLIGWVQVINDSVWRATDFLVSMLDYSRQSSQKFERIEVIGRMKKTLTFLEFRIRNAKVNIETEFPDSAVVISGIPGELDQVFTNLIVNSLDATSPRGKIRLTVSRKTAAADDTLPRVEIRISDTGTGIPGELREKIFEPFFTTKSEGKGTGLGMYIVHTIIEKHGGTIDVESTVGEGTTFIINLPISE